MHALSPAKLQIAEDLQTYDKITQTTKAGGVGFDTQWDAAFFHPVDDNLVKANDADRSMAAIAGALIHATTARPRSAWSTPRTTTRWPTASRASPR